MGDARVRGCAPIAPLAGQAAEDSARLFVALAVPPVTAAMLQALQPEPVPGVRLTCAPDMHLTLHFLGSYSVRSVLSALAAVTANAFGLKLTIPGRFDLRGGRRVLFVGAEASPTLLALHAAVGSCLGAAGFAPETRPYRPHITLARLAPRVPQAVVSRFEAQRLEPSATNFRCDRFALWSSGEAANGSRYRIVESFPLTAAAAPDEP